MDNDQASLAAQTPNQKSEFPDPMEYTPRPLKPLPKELITDSPPATADASDPKKKRRLIPAIIIALVVLLLAGFGISYLVLNRGLVCERTLPGGPSKIDETYTVKFRFFLANSVTRDIFITAPEGYRLTNSDLTALRKGFLEDPENLFQEYSTPVVSRIDDYTAKITMTASIDSIVGEGRPGTRLEMKRRASERKTFTCH